MWTRDADGRRDAWRYMAVLGFVVVVLALFARWPQAFFPLVGGFLLAYAARPLSAFFERRRLPAALGFVVVLVLALAFVVLVVFVFVPALVDELVTIGEKLPSWREVADERIGPLLAELQARFPQSYKIITGHLTTWAESNLPSVAQRMVGWALKVLSGAVSFAGVALNLVLIPVIAAYLTVDFRTFVTALRKLVPRPILPQVQAVVMDINQVLTAFVRGQLLVAAALGLMYTGGLAIVRAPLALIIGPIAGILALVPYLGLIVGAGSSILLTFLEYQDLWHPLGVLIVFVVAQNIEGWVLTPRLLGRSVGLHPVWVLVALLLGGELFGITGIILAVPVAAALRVVLVHAVRAYSKTTFYTGDVPSVVLYVSGASEVSRRVAAMVRRELVTRKLSPTEVDVDASPSLQQRFGDRLPVLEVEGQVVDEGDMDAAAVRRHLDEIMGDNDDQ